MGSLLGQQITPQNPTPWINQAYQAGGTMGAVLGAMGNSGLNYNQGGASSTFASLPGYAGQLSPTNTDPYGAGAAWQPWNAGTEQIAGNLQGYGQVPSQYQTAQSNMAQYGGIGGYPTDLMHSMAQYGGTGGAGNVGMSNLMQYGSASNNLQGLNNISQYGSAGTWGAPIQSLASTPGQSAPGQTLSPYLDAQAYGAQPGADQQLYGQGGQSGQGMAQLAGVGQYNQGASSNLYTGQTPGQYGLNQLAYGNPSFAMGGQQLMGGNTANSNLLQNVVSSGGNPIDQTSAWQSMVGAQQRNIQEGRAGLQAQFDVGGNRFSSAFGQAATDYETQTQAQQNALLGQMTATAGENAQNRSLTAAGQLASQGFGGTQQLAGIGAQANSQLSSQGYGGNQSLLQSGVGAAGQYAGLGQQALSQLSSQGYGSQMAQFGAGASAANQLAGLSAGAGTQLSNLGYGATQGLNQNMLVGTQGLYSGENTGALSMYQGQNSTLPSFMQQNLGQQQLGLQASNDLSSQWNQGLQLGGQLGQQQYVNQQSGLNNAYQNWLYQQPQNNPFVGMLTNASMQYPAPVYNGYQPGALGSLLGSVGSLAGGAAQLAKLSDMRLKTDIRQIGTLGDTPLYSYRFPWSDKREVGVMAQEAWQKHPEAVYPGGDNPFSDPWLVNYTALLAGAARSV